eukprot:4435581-Pleurochrysis_carterae.AAC.5
MSFDEAAAPSLLLTLTSSPFMSPSLSLSACERTPHARHEHNFSDAQSGAASPFLQMVLTIACEAMSVEDRTQSLQVRAPQRKLGHHRRDADHIHTPIAV